MNYKRFKTLAYKPGIIEIESDRIHICSSSVLVYIPVVYAGSLGESVCIFRVYVNVVWQMVSAICIGDFVWLGISRVRAGAYVLVASGAVHSDLRGNILAGTAKA